MVGCKWVRAAATVTSHRLWFGRKVSSVVSPSSVGLEEGAFGASSVAIRSARVVDLTDVSGVIVLVIGSVSTVPAFLPLVLALQTLMLLFRALVLLDSGASLVVPDLG
jgi:hypothetical protein